MLSSMLTGGFDLTTFLFSVFIRLIVVFTAMPLHEFAHGWVAKKLGDPTASNQGRLDLNPLRHIDPIGTTLLIFTGFGWAKPVPINPSYFKNRKVGMALTALAGPVSNILLGTVILILFKIAAFFIPSSAFTNVLLQAFSIMISTNLTLAVFNLLPIPPLDGAKIFGVLLPDRIYWTVMQYERYIMIALLLVMMFTNILSYPLSWLSNKLLAGMDFITGFIDLIAQAVH